MKAKVFLQVVQPRIAYVDSVQKREEIQKHGWRNDIEVELADQAPLRGVVNGRDCLEILFGGIDDSILVSYHVVLVLLRVHA